MLERAELQQTWWNSALRARNSKSKPVAKSQKQLRIHFQTLCVWTLLSTVVDFFLGVARQLGTDLFAHFSSLNPKFFPEPGFHLINDKEFEISAVSGVNCRLVRRDSRSVSQMSCNLLEAKWIRFFFEYSLQPIMCAERLNLSSEHSAGMRELSKSRFCVIISFEFVRSCSADSVSPFLVAEMICMQASLNRG